MLFVCSNWKVRQSISFVLNKREILHVIVVMKVLLRLVKLVLYKFYVKLLSFKHVVSI